MAINYLNSITLNQNELLQGVIENQVNDAGAGSSPVEGQLYFNTTAHVLKQYTGTAWAEVGGGVITLTLNDGTYIDVNSTGDAANPVFELDLNAVDGTSVAATRFLSKDNTWDVPTYPSDANTTYDLAGVGSTNGTAGVRLTGSDSTTDDVLIVGGGTTTVTRSANTLTVTSNDEFDGTVTSVAATHAGNAFTASIGNTSTINPSVDITMAGASTDYINGLGNLTVFPAIPTVGDGQIDGRTSGLGLTGSMDATANQSGDTTFTVASNATVSASANTLMYRDLSGYSNVVTPASGDSSTKIATTAFVQASLTGLLEFKGGFNASTGAIVGGGNLTSGATRVAVAVGDYYVVTVAGDFFGSALTPLTIGDSVIVQTAAVAGASVEGDFIVVQSDTDLATSTTVGLGNVNASTDDEMLGINVAYDSGTAKVGLAISDLTTVATTADASLIPIFDEDEAANRSISVSDLFVAGNAKTSKTGAIAAGSLSGTVAHAFGQNTLVQTFDTGSGATVFCDVVRSTTTPYTITATISATQTNAITILVQKIG